MNKGSTKKAILDAALNLFSETGYGRVRVSQIAEAVGIKAPSLYKHYKSKQDIFNAILDEMERRYSEQAASMQISGSKAPADFGVYSGITEEQLILMGKNLFLYFLHDEYVCKFRKMLTIEQYHNKELAALYSKQYGDDPLSYQGAIFGLMVHNGFFREEDPDMMALHFYAPLYLLLNLCDCQPQREPQALLLLEKHIRHFNRLYQIGGADQNLELKT